MNKKVATEIVKAGYRALAKRYHPDGGGTHEAMIVLTDTHENLLKCIDKGDWSEKPKQGQASGRRPYEDSFHARSKPGGADDFRQKAKGQAAGPILEKYGSKYFIIRNVHCVGATPKAIQVMFPGNPTPAWIPRSQVHPTNNSINAEGDRGNLIITDWIAAQKGWSVS